MVMSAIEKKKQGDRGFPHETAHCGRYGAAAGSHQVESFGLAIS